MQFNSLEYVQFLVLVFIIYWIISKRLQNILLLAASYYFYASWNWKFPPGQNI